MSAADGRGSAPQRHLFDLTRKLFPKYSVIYEQVIPELGQRYDIFVKELGIAIEYDGRQHDEYVEHFHKDVNGFISALQLDGKKERFSSDNGIKVVRFKGDVSKMDVDDLDVAIDKVEYPETIYSMDCLDKVDSRLEFAREIRHKNYLMAKESFSKDNR